MPSLLPKYLYNSYYNVGPPYIDIIYIILYLYASGILKKVQAS